MINMRVLMSTSSLCVVMLVAYLAMKPSMAQLRNQMSPQQAVLNDPIAHNGPSTEGSALDLKSYYFSHQSSSDLEDNESERWVDTIRGLLSIPFRSKNTRESEGSRTGTSKNKTRRSPRKQGGLAEGANKKRGRKGGRHKVGISALKKKVQAQRRKWNRAGKRGGNEANGNVSSAVNGTVRETRFHPLKTNLPAMCHFSHRAQIVDKEKTSRSGWSHRTL